MADDRYTGMQGRTQDAPGARTNLWNSFHDKCKALMEEEDAIVRRRELRDWFHGTVLYEESGEFGAWSLASITTESIEARFEVIAAEAGLALGSPSGTQPHIYFLHRLFLDLGANRSGHIRMYSVDSPWKQGGVVERLLEASATYCARQHRKSLDAVAMSRKGLTGEGEASDTVEKSGHAASMPPPAADPAEPGHPPRAKRGPKPDFETALRVAGIVARVAGADRWRSKLQDICFELDENSVPCPKTWKQRGHNDWVDALSEQPLVAKAIEHHLELAAQHRETLS